MRSNYLRQKKVSDDDIVLIHDGVRPYIELDIIASVTKEASEAGGSNSLHNAKGYN